MILAAAFTVAGFLLGGLYAVALVRDRMRDDKRRFELMWNGPRDEAEFWQQYDLDELRQQRDEAC